MACLALTLRDRATPGVVQNRPTSMPLTPKVERSEAMARSQLATSWQPAAVAMPSIAAITGLGRRTTDCISREQTAKVSAKKPLPASESVRWRFISFRSWPAENSFSPD